MKNIENFEDFLNEGQASGKPIKVVEVGTDTTALKKVNAEIKKSIAGGGKVHMSMTEDKFHVLIEIPAGTIQYNLPAKRAKEVVDISLDVTGGA